MAGPWFPVTPKGGILSSERRGEIARPWGNHGTQNLRFRRRIDDPGRIGAGTGGQDGVNGAHGVFNTRSIADRQPSFQCDLAALTGPVAAYHDRLVVRRARARSLLHVP